MGGFPSTWKHAERQIRQVKACSQTTHQTDGGGGRGRYYWIIFSFSFSSFQISLILLSNCQLSDWLAWFFSAAGSCEKYFCFVVFYLFSWRFLFDNKFPPNNICNVGSKKEPWVARSKVGAGSLPTSGPMTDTHALSSGPISSWKLDLPRW